MDGTEIPDFWEEIRRNKRRSVILMITLFMLTLAVGGVIGGAFTGDGSFLWVGAAVAAPVALLHALIGYYAGADVVLAVSGAREATRKTHPMLINLVEEMRIASGLPMPRVYVIPERSPNAFATGRDPEHAAVAVTSGLLERLNRQEIQGVIAHELGHVRNYDIRFAMLAGVMVGTVVLMCDMYWRMLRWVPLGGRRGRDGNQLQMLLIVLGLVLSVLAPIFAYMLQMSISRRREYAADASAVEFTRDPTGLASALKKISADTTPLENVTRATAHLFIADPVKKLSADAESLFATHPPIGKRIALLLRMAHSQPRSA